MKPLPIAHATLLEQAITAAQADDSLPGFEIPTIVMNVPKNPEQGDYASPVALALASEVKRNPLEIANAIAAHLPNADFVGSVAVAPPGYINFHLSKDWLRDQIETIIEAGDTFGTLELGKGKRAQVEFLSANPTGPVTVGRSRGAILGDGTARVLEAAGYDVTREYYFNNAGAQMRKLGESLRVRYLQALGQDVKLEDDHYQGEYLIDFANDLIAEKGDSLADAPVDVFKRYAEEKMFEWIKSTMARVNVHFDVFFNEHSLYENGTLDVILQKLDENGYIYVSPVRESSSAEVVALNKDLKPAHWFRSTRLGDAEDRVLVKSTEEPTYTLPDIAYHVDKVNRGFDLMVNILGSDHYTEAQVVRHGLQALGLDPSNLHVTFMQMVRAVKDGEPVKMSTRRGVYDTLDELIDLTSPDAVRYFLLQRSPDAQLDFDIDLATRQTNENPVYYIQYAHVRCAGIFREAAARVFSDEGANLSLLGEDELAFIRKALELPEVIEQAAQFLQPHRVAYYALELANEFHPMYDQVRVFGEGIDEDVAKSRLRFYRAAQILFKRVLDIMGMSTPERM